LIVIVSLILTDPFQSIRTAFVIAQEPLVGAQEPVKAINVAGNCAVNSDPALSPCARSPVLVNFTSTLRMFPEDVQAAGSVILTERFPNFEPTPQTLKGDAVFLGDGAAVMKSVEFSLLSAQPRPILIAARSLEGDGVEPRPSKQFALLP
jgi:hypothetical protein